VHCDPKLETGLIAIKEGAISSAADMATISLRGPGGHTARPERTVDIIGLAARVVGELPGRVAAEVEDDSVKVVFGMLRAGDAANVIPTQCTMRASVRTPSTHVWERLEEVVGRALAGLIEGTGASHMLEYVRGVPPVVNHPGITDVVRSAAMAELGPDAVVAAEQSWGGDDFAWYVRQVPGTFVRLGVHDPGRGGPVLDLHSGAFDADEASIGVGIRLLVASAARYFERTNA
jgi:amidohydrolase